MANKALFNSGIIHNYLNSLLIIVCNLDDINFGLVEWKMRKPCFNVIPMTDFVKLDHKEEDYRLDREYKVRFLDTKSGGKFKLFGAILKFIGFSSLVSYCLVNSSN